MLKGRSYRENIRVGDHWDRNLNSHTYENATLHQTVETCDTINHPNWIRKDDAGGNFTHTRRLVYRNSSPELQLRNTNGFLWYDGRITASFGSDIAAPTGNGDAYHTRAYNLMKPTAPSIDVYNDLYELREIPQMLSQAKNAFRDLLSSSRRTRNYGSAYLWGIFGAGPVIGSVLDAIRAQQMMQQRIEWLLRNQGKWIPRRVTLLDTSSESSTDWVSSYGAFEQSFVTQTYMRTPRYRDIVTTKDKIWACAQFKYWLPQPPAGVRINETLKSSLNGFRGVQLWQLYSAIPWSWLIDWCFNASAVLKVLDNGVADRLVARRYYIMRYQSKIKTRQAEGVMRSRSGQPVPVSASTTVEYQRKTRTRGYPFLQLPGSTLSTTQAAILGALGLSKY